MKMASVMHIAEKLPETGQTPDKLDSIRRKETNNTGSDMFQGMLLILLAASGRADVKQYEDAYPVASEYNHQFGLDNMQLPQYGTVIEDGHPDPEIEEHEDDFVHIDFTESFSRYSTDGISTHATNDKEAHRVLFEMDPDADDRKLEIEQVANSNVDIMTDITPELVSNVSGGEGIYAVQPHYHAGRPDIISQLTYRIADMYHLGVNSARIRIEPEELGALHIDISVKDRTVSAVITVEEGMVKDVLENNIDMLVNKLKEAGLSVDKFTVDIMPSFSDGAMTDRSPDGNSGNMTQDNFLLDLQGIDDNLQNVSDGLQVYTHAGSEISIIV